MNPLSRLREIGEFERVDHFFLSDTDRCFFFGEYTPRELTHGNPWDFSLTNKLIFNFKKKVGSPGSQYKLKAIHDVAAAFARNLGKQAYQTDQCMLVPMPPSKSPSDPLHDARVLQMLHEIQKIQGLKLGICNCLSFNGAQGASHEATTRPTIDALIDSLLFDENAWRQKNEPSHILIFDDVLTTGAHFKAASKVLKDNYPSAKIIGFFIARVVGPA